MKQSKYPYLLACMLLLGALSLLFSSFRVKADGDGFLDPQKAFVLKSAEVTTSNVISLDFKIADGYYMYRERFSFKSDSDAIKLGDAIFPQGKVKFDPTFNKDMELYFNAVKIEVPINSDGPKSDQVLITIQGQGCADAGLCYPPMDFVVKLNRSDNGNHWKVITNQSGLIAQLVDGKWRDVLFGSDDQSLAGLLSSTDLIEIVALFFILGLLLALTPCVLPMVPILSVLLVGEQHHVSRGRGFLLSAAYVAGMSVVYTLLGVAAGLSGAGLAAWLQTPWVLGGFAVVLSVLALAMFDVFQFQMPASIQTRLIVTNSHILGGRIAASWMMGAISALIVGPCVAAPLAGALLYISQTGDVILGGLALFAMAWGMGVPLLLMGASAGKLMPRTGPWMEGVKKFFGLLLFATAWWMVTPVLPTWIQILGWAVLAMLGAMLLRTFDSLPPEARFGGIVRKTIGMLLVLICAIWLVGLASGGRSLLQPLSHLAAFTEPQDAQAAQLADASQATSGNAQKLTTNSSAKLQLIAPADATKSLSVIKVGQLRFYRIKSVAQLDEILASAKQPVMLDFYADWCVSCKEMEAFTFVDPKVASRMNQVLLLQADVTANDPDDRALLKRFRLFGPPGIIFFSKDGMERRDIRVVGFQDANRFAATLDRVLK